MELEQQSQKKRVTDKTNAEARRAVIEIGRRLGPMRERIAMIDAHAQRGVSDPLRGNLIDECLEITESFREARVDLLCNLIDAPARVTSHSRVADLEKAIDNLESAVAGAKAKLLASSGQARAH